MKRVVLFLATNIAVLLVLSVVISLLGLDRWLSAEGIDYRGLLAFSAVLGFGGALISLAMSKTMAKWSTGARVIDGTEGTTESWLVQTVKSLAAKAGIGMPEVAVYEGAPNAFATGAFRNSSLVAVSTGLVQSMSKEEVEAVLGHEIGHVANGDMVTLTLIQGVVNTFVVFLSRVVGFFVDKAIFRTERGIGPGFYITVIVCQIVFGILASVIVAWFSRQREFRADAASADLLGTPRPMMNALARLGGLEPGALPASIRTAGITDKPSGFAALFSTHPPVEERIAALQARTAAQA
jgi:heat shock protein HtpX